MSAQTEGEKTRLHDGAPARSSPQIAGARHTVQPPPGRTRHGMGNLRRKQEHAALDFSFRTGQDMSSLLSRLLSSSSLSTRLPSPNLESTLPSIPSLDPSGAHPLLLTTHNIESSNLISPLTK